MLFDSSASTGRNSDQSGISILKHGHSLVLPMDLKRFFQNQFFKKGVAVFWCYGISLKREYHNTFTH